MEVPVKHHRIAIVSALGVVAAVAGMSCSASSKQMFTTGAGGNGGSGAGTTAGDPSSTKSTGSDVGGGFISDGGCSNGCSIDQRSVVDCHGNVIMTCPASQTCDASSAACADACQAAVTNKASVGCEYYATDMDQIFQDVCFA